jgi:3-carboxy-cis,cis-muconate cycloisomerase
MPQSTSPNGFRLLSTLYSDEPMLTLWSEEETVARWLEVESALAQAQAECGLIETSDADAITAACQPEVIDLDTLWKSARTVGYPILPLVRQIAQALPDGPDGRVHYGATTQDIMDTALALQLVASCNRLIELTLGFGDALATLTRTHAGTVMAARTHAQQAVPTTFGAKAAVFLGEVTREVGELARVRDAVGVVSLFGAGGTNAAMGPYGPQVRPGARTRLGLVDTEVPWHVARDRVRPLRPGLLAAGRDVRALRPRGHRPVAYGDRRGARAGGPPPRRVLTDAAEDEPHRVGVRRRLRCRRVGERRPAAARHGVGPRAQRGGVAGRVARRAAGRGVHRGSRTAVDRHRRDTAGVPDAMRHNMDRDGGLLMSEALMMRLAPAMGPRAGARRRVRRRAARARQR